MEILSALCQVLAARLGDSLLGLYVTGSYVWGDFDPERSDIDLVAVLDKEPDEALLQCLGEIHRGIVERFPAWDDRVEVVYAGWETLKNFPYRQGMLAVISPGEPLHLLPFTRDWDINWYLVLHHGRRLLGRPAGELFPSIPKERFVEIVRHEAQAWRTHIQDTRSSLPYQCYACMTLCRALYAVTTGTQASKKRAVEWYVQRHPHSRELLEFCWKVCRESVPEKPAPEEFFPVAEKFVENVLEEIALMQE